MSSGERLQIGQFVTADGNVESHLNISSVHTNDGGLYTCVVSSKVFLHFLNVFNQAAHSRASYHGTNVGKNGLLNPTFKRKIFLRAVLCSRFADLCCST